MAVATEHQVSAGGVAFRSGPRGVEVALISVGDPPRWQLPKGLIDPGETPEEAAVREVREEAGLETQLLAPIDTIEYWYQATREGRRVRYHKRVHFYLMATRGGDVARHDREVNEARFVSLDEAGERLTFASERRVLARAAALIRQAISA